jgi:hypothetical protein
MRGIKFSLLCLMRGGHLGVMNFQRWLLCDGGSGHLEKT